MPKERIQRTNKELIAYLASLPTDDSESIEQSCGLSSAELCPSAAEVSRAVVLLCRRQKAIEEWAERPPSDIQIEWQEMIDKANAP